MQYRTIGVVSVLVVTGTAVLSTVAARDEPKPAAPAAIPPALRQARAVFLDGQFLVRIPMGAATWGGPVNLDEQVDPPFGVIVPRSGRLGEGRWDISGTILSLKQLEAREKAGEDFFRLYREP